MGGEPPLPNVDYYLNAPRKSICTTALSGADRVESPKMPIGPGTRVGRYEVTALLGGGMGRVCERTTRRSNETML